ncbi:MAG: helix-turn-helix domain-containing protein, partial [Actinomycetota bacterium]
GFGVPNPIRTVWFSHEPTAPPERYEEMFAVPVRFSAPANALLFHANRLDDPIDPDAGARLRVLRAHLELVRQQLKQQEDPVELRQIRDAVTRNAARGEYQAEALAGSLGLSLRTLQRRVGELDTSVSALIDEVRSATARQLLSDPDYSLFEIARTLGYSSESAFRRAFRRWSGQSPTQYRSTHAGNGSQSDRSGSGEAD